MEPSQTGHAIDSRRNNQIDDLDGIRRLNAIRTVGAPQGDQDQVQDAEVAGKPATPNRGATALELLSERDRLLLQHLTCLRLLTYSQIHRLVFSSVDLSFARRRIRQLERDGWLAIWEPRSPTGGHVRYAYPTQRTLRQLKPSLIPRTPWRRVVDVMLPRTRRRPLQLTEPSVPKWLPHQREVNQLAVSLLASERSFLWASSWDSPFPSRLGMFNAPQPDYVLVENIDGVPKLIFGEHDRSSEPLDRFVERKIALYSALAKFPEACEQHFGFREFEVHVTVTDPYRREPMERLRRLVLADRKRGGPSLFRFTLAGLLHAYPNDPRWVEGAPVG